MKTLSRTGASLFVLAFLALVAGGAYAHSGGLDANGCHAGSKPYHCHRSPSDMVTTQDGRNRLRCDLGSRSVECVNTPSRRSGEEPLTEPRPTVRRPADADPVELLHHLLVRHCASLTHDLAMADLDSTTHFALMDFEDVYAGELTTSELDSRTQLALLRFRDAYGISEEELLGPQTIEALTGPSMHACQ